MRRWRTGEMDCDWRCRRGKSEGEYEVWGFTRQRLLRLCLSFTVYYASMLRFEIKSFKNSPLHYAALHVSAYLAIIRCVVIRGNCFAFRASAIGVFLFTRMFLYGVNVVLPPMPHILSYACCLSSVQCGCQATGTLKIRQYTWHERKNYIHSI
jgi:hypothetical protein